MAMVWLRKRDHPVSVKTASSRHYTMYFCIIGTIAMCGVLNYLQKNSLLYKYTRRDAQKTYIFGKHKGYAQCRSCFFVSPFIVVLNLRTKDSRHRRDSSLYTRVQQYGPIIYKCCTARSTTTRNHQLCTPRISRYLQMDRSVVGLIIVVVVLN